MLLRSRRFLPLFVTQFLGAFNDSLLKNALIVLITYRLAQNDHAQLLVTLAAGIFILPFFLFSATAGQLADKIDRARIARLVKAAEIAVVLLAALGFYAESPWLLMIALFGMGAHSTFFGPVKYALLPQHLQVGELLLGNAYIEAGTFLAILLGTLLGGLLVLQEGGAGLVSLVMLALAATGYGASRHIPPAPPPSPRLRIHVNIWKETWRIVGFARADRQVFLCILGISWFWLVGATFLSLLAPYVKDVLHAEAGVVTLFLAAFSVGIGAGSFLCNRLLKGRIRTTYAPLGALGIAFFGIDLYVAGPHGAAAGQLTGLWPFLAVAANCRILVDFFGTAVCAGLYIVPLYALMQHRSEARHRARIIAANNVMNALFMVAASLLTAGMLSLHFTLPDVFLTLAIEAGLVALCIRRWLG